MDSAKVLLSESLLVFYFFLCLLPFCVDAIRKPFVTACYLLSGCDTPQAPLWLVFENADPTGDTISIIYKASDHSDQSRRSMIEALTNNVISTCV
jgi:hypothetical protein